MILHNNTPLFTLGGSSPFWVITSLTTEAGSFNSRSNGSRQNGEVVVGGTLNAPSSTGATYVRIASDGSVIDSRRSPAATGLPDADFSEDTVSGDLYVIDNQTQFLVKYDSDFNFVWARNPTSLAVISPEAGVAFSDSGDVHIARGSSSTTGLTVFKFSSSGLPVFQTRARKTDHNGLSPSIAVYGPSGTVYAAVHGIESAIAIGGSLVSYDSAGALRFQVKLVTPSAEDLIASGKVFVASEDEIYSVWEYINIAGGVVGNRGVVVLKMDSSANLLWVKFILGPSAGTVSSVLDPSTGTLYIVNAQAVSTVTSTVYAVSSAGALEWATTISKAGSSANLNRGITQTSEALYLSGSSIPLMKISKTGTPLFGGDFSVTSQATTISDIAITLATQTFTISTQTPTASAVSNPFIDTLSFTETLVRL